MTMFASKARHGLLIRLVGVAAIYGAVVALPTRAYGSMAGMQVWVPDPWETTGLGDYYGPNYGINNLKPVALAGCRNGTFSGHVVVTSALGPIEGLRASMSDLATADGSAVIPASQVRIRYARRAHTSQSWTPPYRFDALLDQAPETVPIIPVKKIGRWTPKHEGPIAMQPIWITIRVPEDAAPGAYEGRLTVESDEDQVPVVRVVLRVADWALPPPADFRIVNLALQSPESVAGHYRVPLWSDRHFKLMGESFRLLAKINSRQVSINLTKDFYGVGGNAETMVRWMRSVSPATGDDAAGETFSYDLTIFDRMLDTVAESIGKPNLLRLNCWMEWGAQKRDDPSSGTGWMQESVVTLLDPATGALSELAQPRVDSPAFMSFWKPLLDEVFRKLEARGWLDVTAFGANSYCWGVHPELIDVAHAIRPDAVWAYTAHNGVMGSKFKGTQPGVAMAVRYPEHIWGPGPGARDPDGRGYRTLLQPRPSYIFHTMRTKFRDRSALRIPRSVVEMCIREGHDGISDFGGDLFPIPNPNRRNAYFCIGNGRGTGGPNASTRALLAPGPNGAVTTERFEAFREGLQLCEAMLFVQKGIDTGKVPADLRARADAVLNERARQMTDAFVLVDKSGKEAFDPDLHGADSFDKENALFAIAAEIAGLP